ncbi:hypothetical protein OG927_34445 (plasmid) [Streptomyces clavifer]|uniref:hypothetical protein n=1 Tax=Streptomyces clavifer TaxID=68188 RepID=UPI002E816E49|nr:hypothetical protein [Streptomyces clavifer]WUC32460.1 hypothetical protein OG927_34445 [Streptomyces clavifer]
MDSTPMPEPLRRAIHQLVSEAVQNCQEVLRYTEPDQAHTWKRMTLYRSTDAADTMNMLAMLIAAYSQRTGTSKNALEAYLQLFQQRDRAAGPSDGEWAHLAGLLGEEAPASAGEARSWPSMQFHDGRTHAEYAQQPEDDPQKLFTEACLHGLKARLCEDVDSLDSYLPPQMAAMARKVAEALEVPELATT